MQQQPVCTSCNAVTLTHAVVCNPPCAYGTGVCVAKNTCSCAPGYFGDTCSEQGKLHSTHLIPQLYMYQLGFMSCIYTQVLVGREYSMTPNPNCITGLYQNAEAFPFPIGSSRAVQCN